MYQLTTNRLKLLIADPCDLEKLAHRFDPTGVVSEIILDNNIHLTASEPHNVLGGGLHSAGRGLSCEFKFDNFEETAVGDYALKLGVGLLKKPDTKPFDHHRDYEKLCFPHELVSYTDQEIAFRTTSIECNGYQAEHIRTIRVEDNTIHMTVSLKNTCNRPITFREYCHNFFSIDGLALGPGYTLTMPQISNLEHIISKSAFDLYNVNQNTVMVKCYKSTGTAFMAEAADVSAVIPFTWELSHKGAKISIKAAEDFTPSFVQVWSYDHMICPEAFMEATVLPGESTSWHRSWVIDLL